ncbi:MULTISPECIES: GntR family transcriptional regulator [unclassified Arthrobacter]|uniref:GntR family transcriptional regulator n=1 Tax=unclassified Arthrobacter TaxID=235627 RepID=UPI001C85C8A9|nr:GntR family transcriptional regulator [Arthrobacter sp. MAHUQ-56]MBX7445971.1 GntR family transcriptional regulator [Arthrobacter sp. MAHUQ-56]
MAETVGPRSTLQDRVYTRLQNEIANGELAPGSKLLVAHLAERFGTSQAPVREALRRLTEEGVAVTVPYAGTVVKEPTWEEIEDIYLLREELEAFAVRRILTHSPTKLQGIKRAFRDLQRAVRAGDPVAVIDADVAFHQSVCVEAGSSLTLEVWTMIVKRFRGVRLLLERANPDDLSTVIETHGSLVDALETGDAELAEKAFREHLRSAARNIKRRYPTNQD